ncbi:MAG: FkbM family methyltransferase [Reyranellales bacterium]
MAKTGVNRFQAIGESLKLLHALGYRPRVIIDGGAHLGSFALEALAIFPDAKIHMIEPQPACLPPLEALAAAKGFVLHPCLLTSEDEAAKGGIQLQLAADCAPTTGAHVFAEGDDVRRRVSVPLSTLDRLFAGRLAAESRTFLKLDLQGHELSALKGAETMLGDVEVILTEASFIGEASNPRVAKLISLLDQKGFDLFDIASISARPDKRAREGDFVFVRRGTPLLADTRWN